MTGSGPTLNEPAPQAAKRGGLFGTDQILYGVLALLAIVGMAVADFSARYGLWFWLAMIPVFAGVCIYTVWDAARARGESRSSIVWRAYLHWSILPLVMYVIYTLESTTGRLNREDAGLVALLSLALTTLFAAVHFDWRLVFLGAILMGTAVASAFVEEFFWVGLIPAVAFGAFAVMRRRS